MADFNLGTSLTQNWDARGRVFYTDENGNKVDLNTPFLERVGNRLKAMAFNAGRWLTNENTESQDYKDKVSSVTGLVTMPFGMGNAATGALANKLVPRFGQKIANLAANSAGGGLIGGGAEGLTRGYLNKENMLKTGLQDAGLGFTLGLIGGTGGGYIGKLAAKRGLYNNPLAMQSYLDDYIAGLDNNAPMGKSSRFSKELSEYKRLWQGMGKGSSEGQYLFAGENALTADKQALNKAKELFNNGIDDESIRQQTGWFKGVDGKWRYEIDDGNFNTDITWKRLNDTKEQAKLSDVYYNNELYDNYPDLKNIAVIRTPLKQYNMNGAVYKYQDNGEKGILLDNNLFNNSAYKIWNDKIDDIYKTPIGALSRKANRDYWNGKISDEEYNKIEKDFYNSDQGKLFDYLRQNQPEIDEQIDSINKSGKKTLIHEIQHLLQEKEGFARGGDASTHPRYGHLAGEVEARLAEQRYDLSEIDKKNINPLTQFDVEPEKQIVRLGNDGLYQKLIDDEEFDYNKAKNLAKDLRNGERNPLKKQTKSVKIEDIEDISSYDKEYLRHELNNNLTEKERKRKIIQRSVGDYIFKIKNNGFDDYEYQGRKSIDDIINN